MKGISKARRNILSKLIQKSGSLITIKNAQEIIGLSRQKSQQFLWSLKRSGWLKSIGPGKYTPIALDALNLDPGTENPLFLAKALFGEYYIGGWSAASFWGLTDQLFRKYWIFTTQRVIKKVRLIDDCEYYLTHINKDKFFGLHTEWINNNNVFYSDLHKTLLDFANYIDVFGLNAFVEIFRAYLLSEEKDLSRLFSYIEKINNKTLFKRFGFFLELFAPGENEAIEFCKKQKSSGYSLLCKDISCDRILNKWNLKVPSFLLKK